MNIPKVGDAVFIQSDEYTGDAIVTYVDLPNIYNHHLLPIQVEVDEGELHQLEEFNHGQVVIRFSLRDIMSIEQMSQQDKFDYVDELTDEIHFIDGLDTQDVDYQRRNAMVKMKQQLQVELPFLFSINEEVIINLGRKVKGIVKKHEDQTMRTYLVQPVDKVHKEPMILSESLLAKIAPEAEPLKQVEDNVQGSLFDF